MYGWIIPNRRRIIKWFRKKENIQSSLGQAPALAMKRQRHLQGGGKIGAMLHLNIEALTILSSLFVRDYKDVDATQLINVSSCGGYTIVPTAVTYCAAKFYVSTFTEGLAWELKETGAKMRAKVLAPAATKTEFGMVANNVSEYDYDKSFGTYHTSKQMAGFLLELYDSEKVVGLVDRESFCFRLADPLFPYAGNSSHNQQRM